ncbi:hypothetical protein [Nonomuraea roseola]|uniref:Uncharacterized protein n=1 Tax=Nonomuraea roseola TaxID=46179 RepID=A0ABV5Q2R1_9ACTN
MRLFAMIPLLCGDSSWIKGVGTAGPGQHRILQRCVNLRLHAGENTLEIRDVEIFLTPAEGLHAGRTAERLHMSAARQPGDQEAGTQRRRPSSSAPAEPDG